MTTYGIREFKTQVSDILRRLGDGEEVIITRRGKPCAKLTPIHQVDDGAATPQSLRGALSDLPAATYGDFLDAKTIWGRLPSEAERAGNDHGE